MLRFRQYLIGSNNQLQPQNVQNYGTATDYKAPVNRILVCLKAFLFLFLSLGNPEQI